MPFTRDRKTVWNSLLKERSSDWNHSRKALQLLLWRLKRKIIFWRYLVRTSSLNSLSGLEAFGLRNLSFSWCNCPYVSADRVLKGVRNSIFSSIDYASAKLYGWKAYEV